MATNKQNKCYSSNSSHVSRLIKGEIFTAFERAYFREGVISRGEGGLFSELHGMQDTSFSRIFPRQCQYLVLRRCDGK